MAHFRRPLAAADALVAAVIALWIIGTTLREVLSSRHELISPERLDCGHPTL
jgi:hypothetical protein